MHNKEQRRSWPVPSLIKKLIRPRNWLPYSFELLTAEEECLLHHLEEGKGIGDELERLQKGRQTRLCANVLFTSNDIDLIHVSFQKGFIIIMRFCIIASFLYRKHTEQWNHIVTRSTVNERFVKFFNVHRSEDYQYGSVLYTMLDTHYYDNSPIGIAADAIIISTSGICWWAGFSDDNR